MRIHGLTGVDVQPGMVVNYFYVTVNMHLWEDIKLLNYIIQVYI